MKRAFAVVAVTSALLGCGSGGTESDQGGGSVDEELQDEAPQVIEPSIGVGREPTSLSISGESVWVANSLDGTVSQLDLSSGIPIGSPIPVGEGPEHVASDETYVWVSLANNPDTSNDDQTAVISTSGREFHGDGVITVDSSGDLVAAEGLAWATDLGTAGQVTAMDGADSVGSTISIGGGPNGIAIANGVVWVTIVQPGESGEPGAVARFDSSTREPIGSPTTVGVRPNAIAANDEAVWVANSADNTVMPLDPETGEVAGPPVEVGEEPSALALSEGVLWVVNTLSDEVMRLDAATGESLGDPIVVPEGPVDIAIGGGFAWIASISDNSVTRVGPA